MNVKKFFAKQAKDKAESNFDMDEMLDRMGLQRKQESSSTFSSTFSSIGVFGLGVAVGAGIGMLFAPKRGEEMRSQAMEKFPEQVRNKMQGQESSRYERSAPR